MKQFVEPPRGHGLKSALRTASALVPAAGAFTLLELLIVIGIIGMLAAITVPSLKTAQKSNALAAASQQLIDDIARARRIAIKDRTTVLMVFVPPARAADAGQFTGLPADEKNILLRGQQTAYALYTFRQVGDQPGDAHPRYLGGWRTLPNGYFIPTWKFATPGPGQLTSIVATNSRERAILESLGRNTIDIAPFERTKKPIRVPTLRSRSQNPVTMAFPYIAFGPKGGLQWEEQPGVFVDAQDDGHIPLARGSIFLARDPNDDKQLVWQPADISERPAGNSIDNFHVIVIDKLTGRTRVAKPEISP